MLNSDTRPKIESKWINGRGVVVVVLSTSGTHVVCDGERVFTREYFAANFWEFIE